MYHYNRTLQQATGIVTAITGTFSGQSNSHEIIVARGKTLTLLRLGFRKIQTILSHDVFGYIRSLCQFRLTGGSKDYIVVGSDSGCIVILEYNKEKNVFDKVYQGTSGVSGSRNRLVLGQYLAADPKGRAVMIGAFNDQKLVYVLNRDTGARLTISSLLEVHKSPRICYCICSVDCGVHNPVFAAIELDCSGVEKDSSGMVANRAQKVLTFYELDLALNLVSSKWSDGVDNGANMLVTVPGGGDGPSGVLVCAENFVIYKNQGHQDVRAVIPRRADLPVDRGVLIVSATMHKQKSVFFFLLQTEYGDVFKVTLDHDNERVSELNIMYFDTIPVTSAMCVMKLGFLFAASEFGDHALYKFQAIGADPDVVMETEEGFLPRKLENIVMIDRLESLMPILDMKVVNLFEEETPQIFTLCGRGPFSSLRILRPRPELAISQLAVYDFSCVPSGVWTGVWTVKKNVHDEFDAYIVLTFANGTSVFSIGETVKEVIDSGFLASKPSLAVSLIGDDSLMQVHPSGIRHIRDGCVNDWHTPGKQTIVKVGYNRLQVVIALSGGDIIYFEVDLTGKLIEVKKVGMFGGVACLDIAPLPEGRQKSRFLAVGKYDNSISILSLDPVDCMQVLEVQSVTSTPVSLLFLEVQASVGGEDGANHPARLFLNAGLVDGSLYGTAVDMVTGQLLDPQSWLLGDRDLKLFPILVRRRRAMLCLSSGSWLGYVHQGRFLLTPLSCVTLEYAASLSSDEWGEGVLAVDGVELRVFTIERLWATFSEKAIPLRYTPRKFVFVPKERLLVTVESDQGAFSAELREMDGGDYPLYAPFGYPKAEADKWVSCIRVLDPRLAETRYLLELPDNQVALSICTVETGSETLIAVGIAEGLSVGRAKTLTGGCIHIFECVEGGRSLVCRQIIKVEGAPLALCQFSGWLLAGIGSILRLYAYTEKMFHRKCENKLFPHPIDSIHAYRDRIYVGDIHESFHYCKYICDENQLYVFADASVSRWLSAACYVDFDTMAGADKFGDIFLVRLPQDVPNEIEIDPTCRKIKQEQGKLYGDPNKVEEIVQFHVGDVVTCMQKTSPECVMYGTVMGSLGALLAISSRDDWDFFSLLERHMRQEYPPLCGSDHMAYRSSYFPLKGVIDGDLCEQYPTLPLEAQWKVANELLTSPAEILKKLKDVTNTRVFKEHVSRQGSLTHGENF